MNFEFVLPRNTKQKALNMVINSNDRKKMSFAYGGLSNEKGHYKLVLEVEEVRDD